MATPSIMRGQLRLIIAITTVHVIAWFAYLSQVPLGQYLGPSEQSVLERAFSLANGSATEGLTYTLYEFGMSILARIAASEQGFILLARSLNGIALILTTALCARSAGDYWKKNRAVWVSGFLVGLNPILLFWARELSPTLLTVLCAALIYSRLLIWLRKPTIQRSLIIGVLLATACALETNLIFFALAWPLVAWAYPHRNRLPHLIAAVTAPTVAFLLLVVSSIQLQDPIALDPENMGQRIYEVFNSHEPYDGKSYSLHNQVNAFLFVNPLHWGVIFIMAVAGCYTRLKDGYKGNSVVALAATLALFSISYALSEAGSQTRAALFPILGIYAGGAIIVPRVWTHAGKRTRRRMVVGLLALVGITYSDFYGARSHTNWERDYAFLAEANLDLRHNKNAEKWAAKALEINPRRDDMRSILVRSVFNEWALSPNPTPLAIETAQLHLEATQNASIGDPQTRAIEAVYHFKLRDTEEARRIWNTYLEDSAIAFICLYWTGTITAPRQQQLEAYRDDPYYDLAIQVININRNSVAYSEGERLIDNMLANAH